MSKTSQADVEKLSGPEWGDRFLAALRETGTVSAAVLVAKVGRRTVYDEINRNPEFAAAVRQVKDECVELVEHTLYQSALTPAGTQDRALYLKAMKPERFSDRVRPHVDRIRAEARLAAIKEMQQEVAALPDDARRIVMAALSRMETKQLPAGPPVEPIDGDDED